jgi:tetratricopeptide (TPR) repeat protein
LFTVYCFGSIIVEIQPMFNRPVWLILMLLLPAALLAQRGNPARIEKAIEYLELNKAADMALKESDPKLKLYYQARIVFVHLLVNEGPDLPDRFLSLAKSSIQALEALPDSDPQKNVVIAELFFLRGVVKALDKRYVSSVVDFKSACTLIDRNSRQFPDNPDQSKLLGVYHVAMSAIPRKLQWLSSVLCFKGDLQTGIDHLKNAAENSKLLPNESRILLFYFEKNLLDRPKEANERITRLHKAHPNSIVFNYLLLSSWLELRENDKALDLCTEWEKRRQMALEAATETAIPELPIWHYTCGKAWFFKLRYDKALLSFDRFLDLYQGKTLHADALYRKGMSLILSDRYEEAQFVFHKLAQTEASGFDVDEYASRMAATYLLNEPAQTDKDLYEARNLFDGGYYYESLARLSKLENQKQRLTENHKTELYYRLGRNCHALDSMAAAGTNYQVCLDTEPGRNLWMKVYAHYYMGRLAESNGDFEQARTWYKSALEFNDYPYQSGLEQRCKAALQQMKYAKNNPEN